MRGTAAGVSLAGESASAYGESGRVGLESFHLVPPVLEDRWRLPAAPLGLDLICVAHGGDHTPEIGRDPDGWRTSPPPPSGAERQRNEAPPARALRSSVETLGAPLRADRACQLSATRRAALRHEVLGGERDLNSEPRANAWFRFDVELSIDRCDSLAHSHKPELAAMSRY
jgi:hypothetical protein